MRHALVAALLVALSGPIAAEGSLDGKEWEDSPEAYFMTREEREEWELVKSEDEAKRFVVAFRARRGPEFVSEVRRRAGLVDERLALGESRASATLRGRIVILLGAPAETRVRHIPTTTVGSLGNPLASRKGGASAGPPQPTMIGNGAGWVEYVFHYSANPGLGIGPEGWTVITEANAASGKDRLRYRRARKKMDEILDAAARRSVRNQ